MPSVVLAARFMTLGDQAGRGTVTINPITCSQQSGGSACGLFACAWYYLICAGLMNPFAREGSEDDDHPSTFEFDDDELFEWNTTFIRMGKFTMNRLVGNGYCADTISCPPFTRIQPPTLTARRNKRQDGWKTTENPGRPALHELRKDTNKKRAHKKRALPTGQKGGPKKKKKAGN